jgi:hypothetical protein
MGGWVDGWVGVKAVLRIAYSNQKWKEKFSYRRTNFFAKFNQRIKTKGYGITVYTQDFHSEKIKF